ncbi:hypothetical protein KVA01_04790 [Kocuria varians]|uniref:Uncharacterized protein n=1 Tax=Kocuria varians TaxID=1272 RepID=A0A4Y4D3M9_KOCVA|nr:hypothetical protein KVA01_04790 [Kocuria varians]
MASTAAPSALFLSPAPTQWPPAIAAASVTRTSSSAKFRSATFPELPCWVFSATLFLTFEFRPRLDPPGPGRHHGCAQHIPGPRCWAGPPEHGTMGP